MSVDDQHSGSGYQLGQTGYQITQRLPPCWRKTASVVVLLLLKTSMPARLGGKSLLLKTTYNRVQRQYLKPVV